jgi:diacylglycerol kinase
MNELINDTVRKSFSMAHRLKSFSYAWAGIKALLRTEHNARIHLAFTVCAIILSMLFKLTMPEITLLIIVVAMVWIAELFNTCFEKLMDFLSAEIHPQVKLIKDMAAAAVLVASFAAFTVGAIIFIPKIFNHVPFSI